MRLSDTEAPKPTASSAACHERDRPWYETSDDRHSKFVEAIRRRAKDNPRYVRDLLECHGPCPYGEDMTDPITGSRLKVPIRCSDHCIYDASVINAREYRNDKGRLVFRNGFQPYDIKRADYDWWCFEGVALTEGFKKEFILVTEGMDSTSIDPCDDSIYEEKHWMRACDKFWNTGTEQEYLALRGLLGLDTRALPHLLPYWTRLEILQRLQAERSSDT